MDQDVSRRSVLGGAAAGLGVGLGVAAAAGAAPAVAAGRGAAQTHKHARDYVITGAYVVTMDPELGDLPEGRHPRAQR